MILEAVPGREIMTARKSAIPTQKIAAAVCGLGLSAYMARENDQDKFELGELTLLYNALGTDGQDTIAAYVSKKFPVRV